MRIDGQKFRGHISLAVTTYGSQSYYTYACLEAIREWKHAQHELIVACHDPSLLLEYYLKACVRDGLIDHLIFTDPGFGHTRGVNRCFQAASGEYVFNITNDILLGDALVGDCADKLANEQVGMVGWHWHSEGARWHGEELTNYRLQEGNESLLPAQHEANIREAAWFTGKTFRALGEPKWLHLCNTSFFGMRKSLWERIGGFDYQKYPHYWADDFLSYAVLDQGLDVIHFEQKFRKRPYFAEFAYDNVDTADRRRNEDRIDLPAALEDYTNHLSGGLAQNERQLLFQIARSLGPNKTILHVGLWRGTGLCLFLKAMQNVPADFIGFDCFDDPEVAKMSAQGPVSREECLHYLKPFLSRYHTLTLIKGNTLETPALPRADVIFIDAGHTLECVENDLKLAQDAIRDGGLLIFHDYGQPMWPAVKEVVDGAFPKDKVRVFGTLAVVEV